MTHIAELMQLAILPMFLRLSPEDAQANPFLPEHLQKRRLPFASAAVDFAAGNVESAITRLSNASGKSLEESRRLIFAWQQKAIASAAVKTSGLFSDKVSMWTKVMGVTYRFECANSFGQILLCENLLGVVEAMLTHARWELMAFLSDEIIIQISESKSGRTPPDAQRDEVHFGTPLTYQFSTNLDEALRNGKQGQIAQWVRAVAIQIIVEVTIDPIEDLMAEITKWDEAGTFSRAIAVTPTSQFIDGLITEEQYDVRRRS